MNEDPDSRIISGVIEGMKQSFLDEGVDLAVLEKLQALWVTKLGVAGTGLSVRDVKEPVSKAKRGGARRRTVAAKMKTDTEDSNVEDEELSISGDCEVEDDTEAGGSSLVVAETGAVKKRVKKMKKTKKMKKLPQVDGPADSSDEDDGVDDDEDGDDDDDDDDSDINPDGEDDDEGVEEEPLGSEDDISDEDASDLFETDNVVVCQYDKITRARNKWKFHLKDGIMNLNGKDYVFQRAHGDAEW